MIFKNKILGIGLPRTGTYSLKVALEILGYSAKHYPLLIEDIDHYEACSEVRFSYDELEDMYPGSLYIMTIRDIEGWLASCKKHCKKRKPNWNPFWDDQSKWQSYYQNNKKLIDVINHDRLLILDVFDGDGWDKLCSFWNKQKPSISYPHTNKSNA